MGKSSTRFHVWRIFFWKKRQPSAHFQERPGITLDFRGLLGYYGYIVVESGIKNPFCGVKW
jgi:hypothetical protein